MSILPVACATADVIIYFTAFGFSNISMLKRFSPYLYLLSGILALTSSITNIAYWSRIDIIDTILSSLMQFLFGIAALWIAIIVKEDQLIAKRQARVFARKTGA